MRWTRWRWLVGVAIVSTLGALAWVTPPADAKAAADEPPLGRVVHGVVREDAIATTMKSLRTRDLVAVHPDDMRVFVRETDRNTYAVLWYDGPTLRIAAEVNATGTELLQVHGAGVNVMPSFNVFASGVLGTWWAWALSLLAFVVLAVPARTGARRRGAWIDIALVAALCASAAAFLTLADDPDRFATVVATCFGVSFAAVLGLALRAVWLLRSRSDAPAWGERARVPTWLVVAILVVLVIGRLTLVVTSAVPSEIGIAGAAGAELLLGGSAVYGDAPTNAGDRIHGNADGPLNYIAYAPAYRIVGLWQGDPEFADVGLLTAALADLLCIALLIAAVRQLNSRASWNQALRAGALWAACPLTTFSLMTGTNDALFVAPLLGAVLVLTSPVRRGLLVGAAVAIKLTPVFAITAFLRVGKELPLRAALRYALGGGIVAAVSVAFIVRYPHGLQDFADTLSNQGKRDIVASMWGQWGLEALRPLMYLPLGIALAALAWRPRERSAAQVAAGCALVLALAQLVLNQWWYPYALWVLGPFLVAALVRNEPDHT